MWSLSNWTASEIWTKTEDEKKKDMIFENGVWAPCSKDIRGTESGQSQQMSLLWFTRIPLWPLATNQSAEWKAAIHGNMIGLRCVALTLKGKRTVTEKCQCCLVAIVKPYVTCSDRRVTENIWFGTSSGPGSSLKSTVTPDQQSDYWPLVTDKTVKMGQIGVRSDTVGVEPIRRVEKRPQNLLRRTCDVGGIVASGMCLKNVSRRGKQNWESALPAVEWRFEIVHVL
ncbi:hypothetical protein FB45DRAFT_869344 [Roridomyces roridus]|uniref:Uncharacterized protein n=1 Tax=Roridomyces roridus TaxID=1738132 RepID=A0AAD7BLK9_9AGAR|nr:hypothetical protein FB45DRAFT_869344 [Roridomyces roridus]